MDFVEIYYICDRKTIIKAVKRIINSDEMCRSYNDLNFGVTFLEHSVFTSHMSFEKSIQKQGNEYYMHPTRSSSIIPSATEWQFYHR